MDTPQTSAQSLGVESRGLLSAPLETQHTNSSRHRSTSVSSNRSAVTVVENNSDIPQLDGKATIKRRQTQIVSFHISWWNCLLGVFFGPGITERAAAATAQATEMDNEEEIDNTFDNKNCPFIVTVHVLPSTKAATQEHQQARCTFDTGCLQGNIVSKEFARKLGFSSADLKPLNSRESNGGTSATGHAHIPEGIVYLTWYHHSSPRLFSGMRFLVSPSEHFDIVIGAHSILRHKLLLPPNLSFGGTSGVKTLVTSTDDKAYAKLRSNVAELKSDIETLEMDRREPRADIATLDKTIKKKKHSLKVAELERDLYAAQKHLEKDKNNKTYQGIVKDLQQQLNNATKKPKKEDKSQPSSSATPHIQVSAPKVETTPGSTHQSRSSRQKS